MKPDTCVGNYMSFSCA